MASTSYVVGNENGVKKRGGTSCRVTLAAGLLMVVIAIVLAAGVGLLVHFLEKEPEVKCVCPEKVESRPSRHTDNQTDFNVCLAKAKDPASEICRICTSAERDEVKRLPRNVNPFHYDVEITPDMYGTDLSTFSFSGFVKITMECLEPSNRVVLHANQLDVTSGSVKFEPYQNEAGAPSYDSHGYDPSTQFLTIHLNKAMVPGTVYTLQMNFTGPLRDDNIGLFIVPYKEGTKTVYMAATQFEALDARKGFPCFDEPDFKARFTITIVRKNHVTSICNTMKIRTEDRGNGYVADVYPTTPLMSTYLVAYVISDFGYISDNTTSGLQVRVWGAKDSLHKLTYALDIGKRTLSFYEDYFNISFPLPKQDMVAIPNFPQWAMENWGLITYKASRLFNVPGVTSYNAKMNVLFAITHELAHQWFGNLVTMKWWDDIWLNEGFATFVQFFGSEQMEPDFDMYNQFVTEMVLPVLETDATVSSHPLFVAVRTMDEIGQVFDVISYNKGGAILRMVKFFLGPETFKKGLQRYLKSKSYQNAGHEDLWAALNEQAKEDKKDVNVVSTMETWTLQMNYPVVRVSRTGDRKLRLQQSRFLLDPGAQDTGEYISPFNYKWDVPFTFTTSQEKNFNVTDADTVWIRRTDPSNVYATTVSIPDLADGANWIVGNVRHHGYYRVNYDDENWRNLIKQLETNHEVIIPIQRAQIVSDALDLARAGMLDQRLALGTLSYLPKERNYYAWATAGRRLGYLAKMLRTSELSQAFQDYTVSLVKDAYSYYGLEDNKLNYVDTFAQRDVAAIACGASDQDCVYAASREFQRWRNNPDIHTLHPDLRTVILCTGIAEGSAEDWFFLFNRFVAETSPSTQDDMLMGLTCPQKPWLIDIFFKKLLTPREVARNKVSRLLIFAPDLNPTLRPYLWDFLREHYDVLQKEYSANFEYFTKMILSITSHLNTDFQLRELETFVNTTRLGTGSQAFKQAVVTTKANIRWMKRSYDILKQFLTDRGFFQEQAVNGKLQNSDSLRLPTSLKPIHYDLEIRPHMYTGNPANFTFDGKVRINVECLEPTDRVILHIHELSITSGSIRFESEVAGADDIHYISHTMDKEKQFLIVKVSKELVMNGKYFLEMTFSAPMKSAHKGLFWSSYQQQGVTKYLASTQFESTFARTAFPCFDEPALKATFSLTLVRKNLLKTTSNMPINRMETRADEFEADIYQTTPLMSTYLIAYVFAEFGYINGTTSRGVKFRLWSRPDVVEELRYALSVGVKVMSFYEDYFNQTYPLPKQDLLAIPDVAWRAGAMENWGLIIFSEGALLYDPVVHGIVYKQRVASVVAHEMVHQWFGDLVSPKWWDDLWLNEGFASFLQYTGVDIVDPTFQMQEQFVPNEVFRLFDADATVTSHPIAVNVQKVEEIQDLFDAISYSKGSSVLRMLKFAIGETTLRNGLARYISAMKYSNADHNDLWKALHDEVQSEGKTVDVVDMMKTWTLQMNYPVVHVTRVDNTHLRLQQSRYLDNPEVKDPLKYSSVFGYKWNIPFTFTTSLERDFNKSDTDIIWMLRQDQSDVYQTTINVPDTSGWILGNIGVTGVYRVQYEESNWRALIKQLKSNHKVISGVNRAQLLYDAWALGSLLDGRIPFQMMEYLSTDDEYLPWFVAQDQLRYTGNMLQTSEMHGRFQKLLAHLTTHAYNRLGLQGSGSSLETLARQIIVDMACGAQNQNCTSEVRDLFQKWKQDSNRNRLDPNLRVSILCIGVSEGPSKDWEFVWDAYLNERQADIKEDLLYALTCTREEWLAHTLLQRTLKGEEIPETYSINLAAMLAANPRWRSIVWNFAKNNWNLIKNRFVRISPAALINTATASFNTKEQLKEIEDFIQANPDLGGSKSVFVEAADTVRSNIKWMETNYPVVKKWLEDLPLQGQA